MLFEKVNENHILKGIEDYETKGLPDGFGPSSTYDLVYNQKKYPPKAIMAYANFHASGRKIEPYFKGGIGTDCFNTYEANGFSIIKKDRSNMYENLYQLKQDFLDRWPIERLERMTLPEYTDTNRADSFCYWQEHVTRDLGSIVGGSSYKFGIYKMNDSSETKAAKNRTNDGVYAWHLKYGNTAIEAFNSIKEMVVQIAKSANSGHLDPIEDIDLGDAYKWKIAFMYSDYGVINIFKKDALKFIANSLYPSDSIPLRYGELHSYIISKQGEEDYYVFAKKLWKHYDKYNSKEEEFRAWLKSQSGEGSNKSSSYLRAIKILIHEFHIAVYTEDDINLLQDLYEDLILNQKDQNGKYAYSKRSYGEKGFFSAAIKSYIKFLNNDPLTAVNEEEEGYGINITKKKKMPLNQIFYGPPGTGKTFNTINEAIAIVDPEFDLSRERTEIVSHFQELVNQGLIVFTTFHQSMSYEDFVEGIKPKITDTNSTEEEKTGEIEYQIEDGILKDLVNSIKDDQLTTEYSEEKLFVPQELFDDNIVKISLGDSTDPEDESIYQYCIDNNLMALGFGEDIDFTGITSKADIRKRFKENNFELKTRDFNVDAIERFVLWAKKGRLVFASLGTKYIRAIGVIEGDYFCDPDSPIRYSQFKPVRWLHKDLKLPIKNVYNKLFSHQSIYVIFGSRIKKEFFAGEKSTQGLNQNRVLIIDEINRGNVSAIFGELITLLEEDKREGEVNELSVKLPYSKKEFTVPNSLYIIGTMNTADRSVEALDTALRRRFEFKEMMPDYTVIQNEEIDGIKLSTLLETINDRIEMLIDRDHTIGHSYFVGVDTPHKLSLAFNNKIMPLLQEYFYGDYGKIGLVLGNGFVEKNKNDKIDFADFTYEGSEDFKTPGFSLIKQTKETILHSVRVLLGLEKSKE